MHFKTNDLNSVQLDDPNLRWFYDLKMANKGGRPVVGKLDNKERISLLSQWNRIVVLKGTLYREYVDSANNMNYQFIVPRDHRLDVLKQCHDSVYSGHLGAEKTVARIVAKFYWFKQLTEIQAYVQSCRSCQQIKVPRQYNVAPLTPLTPTRPWELVTTDIMGPLPNSGDGNKFVLVVIDHFTKWVELYPLPEISAKTVANRLMLTFLRFGIPDTLLSDQGSNYQSELMVELCELLDIHKVRTSPYHPQCDGITERFNRTLQAMITSYISNHQRDWDVLLPSLAFAYNTAVHSTTKSSPFELVYGRIPKVPVDLMFEQVNLELYLNPEQYAAEVKENFLSAFGLVIRNRDLRMDRNKIQHDRKVRAANFELHDLVWLLDTAVIQGKCKKLSKRWRGPYKILAKINQSTYSIQPEVGRGKVLVANQCRLQKVFTRDVEAVCDRTVPVVTPKPVRARRAVVRSPVNDLSIVPVPVEEQWPDTAPAWPDEVDHLAQGPDLFDDTWTGIAEELGLPQDISIPVIEETSIRDNLPEQTLPYETELSLEDDGESSEVLVDQESSFKLNETNQLPVYQLVWDDPVIEEEGPGENFVPNNYFQEQLALEPADIRPPSTRVRNPVVRLGI